jgi:hypothetical protein
VIPKPEREFRKNAKKANDTMKDLCAAVSSSSISLGHKNQFFMDEFASLTLLRWLTGAEVVDVDANECNSTSHRINEHQKFRLTKSNNNNKRLVAESLETPETTKHRHCSTKSSSHPGIVFAFVLTLFIFLIRRHREQFSLGVNKLSGFGERALGDG